jgi:hypothetical protein
MDANWNSLTPRAGTMGHASSGGTRSRAARRFLPRRTQRAQRCRRAQVFEIFESSAAALRKSTKSVIVDGGRHWCVRLVPAFRAGESYSYSLTILLSWGYHDASFSAKTTKNGLESAWAGPPRRAAERAGGGAAAA